MRKWLMNASERQTSRRHWREWKRQYCWDYRKYYYHSSAVISCNIYARTEVCIWKTESIRRTVILSIEFLITGHCMHVQVCICGTSFANISLVKPSYSSSIQCNADAVVSYRSLQARCSYQVTKRYWINLFA